MTLRKGFFTKDVDVVPPAEAVPVVPASDRVTKDFGTRLESTPAPLPPGTLTEASLVPTVIPPATPEVSPTDAAFTKVNLKNLICINGKVYLPGEGVYVPTDAEPLWRDSIAKE